MDGTTDYPTGGRLDRASLSKSMVTRSARCGDQGQEMSVAKPVGWLLAMLASSWTLLPRTSAAPAPAVEYVFVSDTDRRVCLIKVSRWCFGTIDSAGRFHQTSEIDTRRGGSGYVDESATGISTKGRAYQFEAGGLTPGQFDRDGQFVPDPKAKVIRLQEYKPGPDAVPIWNLPGYFMTKERFEGRRKWLAEHLAEDPVKYGKEKARLDAAADPKK